MNTNEKLRIYLKSLVEVCKKFHQDLEYDIDGHYDILPGYIDASSNFLSCAKKIEEAALALPRRNCDVGTAEEQIKRFYEYCKANGYCNHCR